MSMTLEEARAFAYDCPGYSQDRYGSEEWAACILMLDGRGYSEAEIQAIMASKWTRWAADSADSEQPTAQDLARFLDITRNREGYSVAELLAGN